MIDTITIENIQSHKNTVVDLSPGVNVIVGTTDCGKSAFLRAIRLVVQNKPNGPGMRSWWGGTSSVSIVLDDGTVVKRVKDKREEYWINDTMLTAFGKEIPKEVTDVLKFSEVNIQRQIDKPFLLDSTPGEVAAHFNKIANLEQIDKSTSSINSKVSQIESSLKSKKNDLEVKEVLLSSFDYLDKFEAEVEAAEALETILSKIKGQERDLTVLLKNIEETKQEIKEYDGLLTLSELIDSISEKKLKARELFASVKELKDLIDSIKETLEDIKSSENMVLLSSIVEKMSVYEEEIKKDKKDVILLNVPIMGIKEIEKQLKAEQLNVQTLTEKFAAEMPDVCPICGSKVKQHKH